jgi:predicted dehydrogenase
VRRHQRVFQFGTQQRSGRMFWQACQLVRGGRIGKLRHINVWAPGSAPGGSRKEVPPPAGLDYDFWLGPAPQTPYTEDKCDPNIKTWWFLSDYTLGFISGWGIHPLDIALWGGGDLLRGSVEVEGRGTFRATEGACDTATIWEVDFRFGSGVTLKFVGIPNGQNQEKATGDPWLHQDEWKARYRRICGHGTAFEGSDGWVHVDRQGIHLEPEALIDVAPETLNTGLVHSAHHVRNFLDCIKSRADTVCPVEAAVAADTLCHVADAATRLGRRLKFDFKTERFLGDDAANQRLKLRAMRKPWRL